CSGKVYFAGKPHVFRGAIDAEPGELPELHVAVPRRGMTPLPLDLVFGDDHRIDGTLGDGISETVSATGWRNTWNKTLDPLSDILAGYFTALLEPDASDGGIGDPNVPQGTGFFSLTNVASGVATWSGKTADGSLVKRSSFIGPDGEFGCWAPLYGNLGSLQGSGMIDGTTRLISGATVWTKLPPIKPGREYPDGFEVTLHPMGGPYSPTILEDTVATQFSADTPNAAITFSEGGLAESETDPNVEGTIFKGTKGMVLTVPLPTKDPDTNPNPGKVKLRLIAKTGLFSGTFGLSDPNPSGAVKPIGRTGSFSGILVPSIGSFAGGYFKLPQLPDPDAEPATTLKTSPILSGKVEVLPIVP
ncbi:MAG: hypothetical protein KDM64_17605, partial [Verrucomicrobiae bacterium]|nr:hypothetical protein [Verrucomicrobiae bacterium]